MPPEVCPNCGAEVPPDAKACPECGSDEQTGWSEAAASSGLGLPGEEDFDCDDFKKREFGGEEGVPRGISWYWWIVGVVVLAVLLGLFLWR
jgi:hypothetical protein